MLAVTKPHIDFNAVSRDDAPTIGERYSRASESSDLRVQAESRCDADYLIAAGWAGDSIGTMLYRLRSEFDQVHACVRPGQALNKAERLLVLSRLKSLPAAKQAIGSMAVIQATKRRFMRPDADALKVAGRVIDVFLDPNCAHCDGRGFTGGGRHEDSGPQALCRPCSGSGKRRNTIGRDDDERAFGAFLLSELERMTSEVEVSMSKFLRQR